ncbi:M48 family metalloprotease [Desulfobulbus sp.]|uniref:M48 family metalloprotease n=1 Tax=Desulfobulbus sp. TaxID=895 RepID=UPI00286F3092|nr:M48 family metalloprotease [Desulfobulbus sp.]
MIRQLRASRWLAVFVLLSHLLSPLSALALTVSEERKIGEQLLFSVRRQFPVLDDPDISQYINTLGKKVLATIGPQPFEYRFFVVQSDQFNAFAAPAGLVFFYTGLIAAMNNEDQLVSVLAHEIGHVVSRHIAQRLDKGAKISALSLIAGIAGLALGVPGLSQGLLTGSLAAGQAANLQYSREDEEQADRLSFGWMQKMGRDPSAMEDMLKSMRRVSRYSMGSEVPQYLLTHPNPDARLGYVESLLEMLRQKGTPQHYIKTDNFDFLRFKYRVQVQSSDLDNLRTYCTTAVTAAGTDKEQQIMAHYGLALLAAEDRNYPEALEQLAFVRERYPQKEILEIDKAVLLMGSGNYDEARRILEQAFRRDPNDVYGAYQLGKIELMTGNYPRAEQMLQRVALAMPEYPQVYYDLGQLAANRGKEGVSGFFLGKYNLYRGKMKMAKQYLVRASKDANVPDKVRVEAKAILDKLKELEKET